MRGEYAAVEALELQAAQLRHPADRQRDQPADRGRGLLARRWIWLAVGLLGQLFIYSFTGYRSAFLSPIALLAVFLLFRRRLPTGRRWWCCSESWVLTLGMWALDVLTGTLDFTSLLVRRFLITPGLLTGAYVWVFADIEKAHLAHSFLKPFLQYPYSREPPQLIGELFFGDPATNANANLLADGFANFGFPGMVLRVPGADGRALGHRRRLPRTLGPGRRRWSS